MVTIGDFLRRAELHKALSWSAKYQYKQNKKKRMMDNGEEGALLAISANLNDILLQHFVVWNC